MKKTLLIGLAAVALGSMTACSNILEEEGSISAKTGSLTITLEADGSLGVATKSDDKITLPTDIADNMLVTAKHRVIGSEYTFNLTKEENIYTGFRSELPTGAYSVTALYGQMTGNLDFGTPIFGGSDDVVVSKGTNASANISATLQNSIIVVDNNEFSNFKNLADVRELYVYEGQQNEQPDKNDNKFSLLESNEKGDLFVKKGLENIYIYIAGTVKKDGQSFGTAVKICGEGQSVTEAAKKYVVKYSLVEATGSIILNINVNGNVTQVNVNASVNPYAPAN